ncbi:MAG TPA: crosslink repair DNA glycosylase YcaQ family protein [Ktedonobacterales bacterium]|nr:crosslink repair DNA glycosylase YcaQ family protein [Ktedonobacterales bacterium]
MPTTPALTISNVTQRRFLLGKQGLFPGRRWRGREGVANAIRAGAVVQVDPLNVVARSHDIVLYGRVLDYQPEMLQSLLYDDHAFFDYGGTVMIYSMEEMPYWRVVMARKRLAPLWTRFAAEHSDLIERVLNTVRSQGLLRAGDIEDAPTLLAPLTSGFRSGKVANQTLRYLWLAGEIMTHSRKGIERVYDLRERIVPADLNYTSTEEEADTFFALRVFREYGLLTLRTWRYAFAGTVQRPVDAAEASARLDGLLAAGKIVPVTLEHDPKTPRYALADDLPLLETLHAGGIPDEWRPIETTTEEEMTFLAPLEIVTARGRALPLFGFEYLWEVYKPQEKRRWGYYTLPILYRDSLVARADLKLERERGMLVVKGFWLEDGVTIDDAFVLALARTFRRFMRFAGADELDCAAIAPADLREGIERLVFSPDLTP